MHIIAGSHKSRKIFAPKGLKTRPTSSRLRGALFNICQHQIEGAFFLDLFAGSGAMGLEALSRGAKKAVFVEQDRAGAACIRRNLEELDLVSKGKVFQGSVWNILEKLSRDGEQFDLIYADPPYGAQMGEISYSTKVLRAVDENALLTFGGMLFIEEQASWEPDQSLRNLVPLNPRRSGRTQLYQFVRELAA